MTRYTVSYELTYTYDIEAASPREAASRALNAPANDLDPYITREGDIHVSWTDPDGTIGEREYGDPEQADDD